MESNQIVISSRAKPLKLPIQAQNMAERVHKLAIFGMTCGCCTGRVRRVLEANPDVLDVKVSFEKDLGVITTTDKLTTDSVIVMVNSAGFIASA